MSIGLPSGALVRLSCTDAVATGGAGGLFTPARGDKRERHSGGKQEQAGGAARNHKRLMIIARLPLLYAIC